MVLINIHLLRYIVKETISIYKQKGIEMGSYISGFFPIWQIKFLLNKDVNSKQLLNDLKQFDDKWFQYNEFKKYIKRDGLCVLNESGENKPGSLDK